MTKTQKPFGLWDSPISAVMLSQRTRLEDVGWSADGKYLLWLEGRSDKGVLVCRQGSEAGRDLTTGFSVRAGVGYGGGDFKAGASFAFFTEKNGRLYSVGLEDGLPRPVTPAFGSASSPVFSPDEKWTAYVWSDAQTDLIGLVDTQGKHWPTKWVEGADFYMQPAWSKRGDHFAWVEWDHPNMPWDGCRLMLADIVDGNTPVLENRRLIAGDLTHAAWQPQFSPDGSKLAFLCASEEWEDLIVVDLENGQERVLVSGDGYTLSGLAWVQGIHAYGWSHDGERLYYLRLTQGKASLWVVELTTGATRPVIDQPYTWISQVAVNPVREEVAFLASSSSLCGRVVVWDGKTQQVIARSESESVPQEFYPPAQPISWQNEDGSTAYGIYYPPTNPQFTSTGLPPVQINIHGGPTSAAVQNHNSEIAFWTSRGYAWLEINYRGSSGYGRSYRLALNGRWGEVDTIDAAGGAHALAAQGLADPGRLVIRGGSAGGYTVLNALLHYPGLFKAGFDMFGVGNLFLLAMDTHKFESHYLDSMVGALPEAAEKYRAWSPIFHIDGLKTPLAVFQGAEDKVVPPNQSEEVVAALRRQGIPHIYRLYEGEGHGFRKTENLLDLYQQMERFLIQQVVFG